MIYSFTFADNAKSLSSVSLASLHMPMTNALAIWFLKEKSCPWDWTRAKGT